MKIKDIQFTRTAIPLKSADRQRFRTAVFVEVLTDEGITGIGESPCMPEVNSCAEILISAKTVLLGKNPANINSLMQELYAHCRLRTLHVHAASWALSGIEMALWDILGKRAGKPLYKVWGGAYRRQIEFAGLIHSEVPDSAEKEAAMLAKEGFQVLLIRMNPASNPEFDLARVASVRRGVPQSEVKIRICAGQAWTTGTAVSIINRMETYGLELIDQPVLMYNLDALKMVKGAVSVPVAGHESSWTMYDVLHVIKENAVDCLHINGRFDLGYNGARISAGMAEAAGIPCILHSDAECGVSFAMNLHMAAATANCTMANVTGYDLLSDDVLAGGMLPKKGPWCAVPENAGIGVSLDPDKVAQYHETYVKEIAGKALLGTPDGDYEKEA